MTDASPPPPAAGAADGGSGRAAPSGAVRDARRAWILGGSLLIAYAVFRLIASGSPVFVLPGASIVLDVLWAGALLVFAFGIRRSGSVVARRRIGVTALVVAALLPFVSALLWWAVPIEAWDISISVMVGQGLIVLGLAALLVATVVIGRAGAVPHRVRWVPLIVLGVGAGSQILAHAVAGPLASTLDQTALVTVVFGSIMLSDLGVLLLGILAIVLAPRTAAPAPVQVYPPVE